MGKVYEIIPNTKIQGYSYELHPSSTLKECRKRCDKTDVCKGFIWRESGLCTLKSSILEKGSYDPSDTSYVKEGNSSYWLLWLSIGAILILLFLSLCWQKK